MALRLRLKPRERVIIGGAAIRNGRSRAELMIENTVPVLRQEDILSPRAVRTPCDRVYLALQLLYVDPERRAEHMESYQSLATEVGKAAPSCTELLAVMDEHVRENRIYRALQCGRKLRDRERKLMSNV